MYQKNFNVSWKITLLPMDIFIMFLHTEKYSNFKLNSTKKSQVKTTNLNPNPIDLTYFDGGGVFKIINKKTNKVFVGAGGNLFSRLGEFFLRKRSTSQSYPQEIWDEYEENGLKFLDFILLETGLPDDLATLWDYWFCYMYEAIKKGEDLYNSITTDIQVSMNYSINLNLVLKNLNQNITCFFCASIYEIKNIKKNKSYFGQSNANMFFWIADHFRRFRKGDHFNKEFQKDWLKNRKNFNYFLIESGPHLNDPIVWSDVEKDYIWANYPNTYNPLPKKKATVNLANTRKNFTTSVYWYGERFETIGDCGRAAGKQEKQIRVLADDKNNEDVQYGASFARYNFTTQVWLLICKSMKRIVLNKKLLTVTLKLNSVQTLSNQMKAQEKGKEDLIYLDQISFSELKILIPDYERQIVWELRKTVYIPLNPNYQIEREILEEQSESYPESMEDQDFWFGLSSNQIEKIKREKYQILWENVNTTLKKPFDYNCLKKRYFDNNFNF